MFTCELCSKTFQLKGVYTDHLKTHTEVMRFECTECPAIFKNLGHLNTHIKERHSNRKKTYKCVYCSKTFKEKRILLKHRKDDHYSLSYFHKCKFCDKIYSTPSNLKWHINTNHNKDFKRSYCPYCPSDFKWLHHLKDHIKKKHIEKGEVPSDIMKRGLMPIRHKTNNCFMCSKPFSKKLDMMLHLREIHKQEIDIFKCCFCQSVFSLENSLVVHLEEHLKNDCDRQHKCDQCFPTLAPKPYFEGPNKKQVVHELNEVQREIIDFELTLMEHDEIKNLIAEKEQDSRTNTDNDLENSTEEIIETKYECEKCNSRFLNKDTLADHLKTHDTRKSTPNDDIKKINGINKEVQVKLPKLSVDELITTQTKNDDSTSPFMYDVQISNINMPTKITDDQKENTFIYKKDACKYNEEEKIASKNELKKNSINKMNVKNGMSNKMYKCKKCNEKFNSLLNVKYHYKEAHGRSKKKTKCEECNTCFVDVTHHTNRKNKSSKICKKCKTNFTNQDRCTENVGISKENKTELSNNKSVSTKQTNSKEKFYECGKCALFFLKKLALLHHVTDKHMT